MGSEMCIRDRSQAEAVDKTLSQLQGTFALVFLFAGQNDLMIAARKGSPLAIGYGDGEMFVGSDAIALAPLTDRITYLEEGDRAVLSRKDVQITDAYGKLVKREISYIQLDTARVDKGGYKHFMAKEIAEQPNVLQTLLNAYLSSDGKTIVLPDSLPDFTGIERLTMVACGTAYYACLTAKYWFEKLARIPVEVDIASEFRYRKSVVHPNSLLITISQSGETADTLAALRLAKEAGYMASLTICNVPGSSLVRESDLAFMTRAGAEIGVASTKAFTTQLTAFLMLTLALGKENGMLESDESSIVAALHSLPAKLEETLAITNGIEDLAEEFADKNHSLFLGRGDQYPIAMEGALKLKEISYIHAEAYASGELKHGPLALIDDEMPVIVVAPNNELLEKLKSNVEEVRARGGIMYVFADKDAAFEGDESMRVINVPHCDGPIAPIIYTLPLQLLSYYVALIKGTDVDQPRNLAKSVTVE